MAAYVGQTKDTLRAKTSTKNSNFPNGINGDTEVRFINSTYILDFRFLPILVIKKKVWSKQNKKLEIFFSNLKIKEIEKIVLLLTVL